MTLGFRFRPWLLRDPDFEAKHSKELFSINLEEIPIMNIRDPHEPVIPGEAVHPPEGHGGVSMPIGVSGAGLDPHEPVMPEGMMLVPIPQVLIQHVEDTAPVDKSLHGPESYGEMQKRVEGELHVRAANAIEELLAKVKALEDRVVELSKPQAPPPPPQPLDEQLAETAAPTPEASENDKQS
jgi:hypothetical protein